MNKQASFMSLTLVHSSSVINCLNKVSHFCFALSSFCILLSNTTDLTHTVKIITAACLFASLSFSLSPAVSWSSSGWVPDLSNIPHSTCYWSPHSTSCLRLVISCSLLAGESVGFRKTLGEAGELLPPSLTQCRLMSKRTVLWKNYMLFHSSPEITNHHVKLS